MTDLADWTPRQLRELAAAKESAERERERRENEDAQARSAELARAGGVGQQHALGWYRNGRLVATYEGSVAEALREQRDATFGKVPTPRTTDLLPMATLLYRHGWTDKEVASTVYRLARGAGLTEDQGSALVKAVLDVGPAA